MSFSVSSIDYDYSKNCNRVRLTITIAPYSFLTDNQAHIKRTTKFEWCTLSTLINKPTERGPQKVLLACERWFRQNPQDLYCCYCWGTAGLPGSS